MAPTPEPRTRPGAAPRPRLCPGKRTPHPSPTLGSRAPQHRGSGDGGDRERRGPRTFPPRRVAPRRPRRTNGPFGGAASKHLGGRCGDAGGHREARDRAAQESPGPGARVRAPHPPAPTSPPDPPPITPEPGPPPASFAARGAGSGRDGRTATPAAPRTGAPSSRAAGLYLTRDVLPRPRQEVPEKPAGCSRRPNRWCSPGRHRGSARDRHWPHRSLRLARPEGFRGFSRPVPRPTPGGGRAREPLQEKRRKKGFKFGATAPGAEPAAPAPRSVQGPQLSAPPRTRSGGGESRPRPAPAPSVRARRAPESAARAPRPPGRCPPAHPSRPGSGPRHLGPPRAPGPRRAAPPDGPEPRTAPTPRHLPNGFCGPAARRAGGGGGGAGLTSGPRRAALRPTRGGHPGASSLRVPDPRRAPPRRQFPGVVPGGRAGAAGRGGTGRGRRRGRRGRGRWEGALPVVTAPPQPRSSLPLRGARAFCFPRGTSNAAAAAMLAPEPGGGGGGGEGGGVAAGAPQYGCASPADGAPGRGPARPRPRPAATRPRGPRTRVPGSRCRGSGRGYWGCSGASRSLFPAPPLPSAPLPTPPRGNRAPK
ncbi:translation initiation factor IF-2-like [Sorex fumeus]|uniref:translation initiation factor IF-2-like n=1 Tax=Sorex fumeus TaxID=62283 RepID=UPI0024ACAD2E|nr:translation initiation factor IF-2-like [Sorex fumeus]